jgi:hypothetical protein
MRVTFAIGVCDEARELDDLLYFLVGAQKVIESGDEVNVLVDSKRVTPHVQEVLRRYPTIVTCERAFDGDFSAHRNYHIERCAGETVFMLDADEIPQPKLIEIAREFSEDILYVPRLNVVPGYSPEFLARHKFKVSNAGYINYPDFQGRIFRRAPSIKWTGKVHEKLTGSDRVFMLSPDAVEHAIWHVKSLRKQDKQNALYDQLLPAGTASPPSDKHTSEP